MNDPKIEKALQEIADRSGGRLTPDQVIEEARDPASPLHDQFTWNDSEAAEKQRRHEARALIRSVTIVVTNRTLVFEVPRYIRDETKDSREQGYLNIAQVRTDEDIARETCLREFDRARAALARAQAVSQYLGVADQISDVMQLVDAVARRTQEENGQSGTA